MKRGRGGGGKHQQNPVRAAAQDRRSNAEASMAGAQQIDGSLKEGGGQVLRNGMSLAGLYLRPIVISNIRANRDKPGLKAQHLAGVRLVKDLYAGKLVGDKLSSMHLTFSPSGFRARDFTVDIGTAGAITLLIQTALPCVLFGSAPIKLTLIGGTNASMAPQVDFMTEVLRPTLAKMGIRFDITLLKRGFYPRGGGIVDFRTEVAQEPLLPLQLLDPGDLARIRIRAITAGLPASVASRMAASAMKVCKRAFPAVAYDVEEVVESAERAVGTGASILLVGTSSTGCLFSGSAIVDQGDTPDSAAEAAAEKLLKDVTAGGCVDEYLQDQLLLFMALAKGTSRVRSGPISLHSETSMHFTSLFTGAKFTVSPVELKRNVKEEAFIIECQGVAYQNPHKTGVPSAEVPVTPLLPPGGGVHAGAGDPSSLPAVAQGSEALASLQEYQ